MTAREKFKIGDRVKLTGGDFEPLRSEFGEVTGFGWRSYMVRIRPDGYEHPLLYHLDNWEPVKEGSTDGGSSTATET